MAKKKKDNQSIEKEIEDELDKGVSKEDLKIYGCPEISNAIIILYQCEGFIIFELNGLVYHACGENLTEIK